MDTTKKNSISKFMLPIILVLIFLVVYFIYQGFFNNTNSNLTNDANLYLSQTKIGKDYDILNKESISFDTNINNNILINGSDFSEIIYPSQPVGRSNPFLP